VRAELRSPTDVHKIARAVIAMAMAQAEADAAAELVIRAPAIMGDSASERTGAGNA